MDSELTSLAGRLGERLLARRLMITTAESCTGGWAAKVLTEIAGSSHWFERGFVTYSNEAKQEMLGVPEGLIQSQGAVSEPVVRAMVIGALANSRADIALSVSGIAGPGGGTPDKPVGTVWFAWGGAQLEVTTLMRVLDGDRDEVRRQAVQLVLQGALDLIV